LIDGNKSALDSVINYM